MLATTGARSVYEVGCNAGWNLTAIKHADPMARVRGSEPNAVAWNQAMAAGFIVDGVKAPECLPTIPMFDLVFTAGVLIHVPPDELDAMTRAIVNASADYVLAVEYASTRDLVEPAEYRGHPEMLWRRAYGQLYQGLGLELVRQWDAGEGFDRCTAWLLRK